MLHDARLHSNVKNQHLLISALVKRQFSKEGRPAQSQGVYICLTCFAKSSKPAPRERSVRVTDEQTQAGRDLTYVPGSGVVKTSRDHVCFSPLCHVDLLVGLGPGKEVRRGGSRLW